MAPTERGEERIFEPYDQSVRVEDEASGNGDVGNLEVVCMPLLVH